MTPNPKPDLESNSSKPSRVCHFTTAHQVNDGRIYYRECRTLAQQEYLQVRIIAPGLKKSDPRIEHISIGDIPKSRLIRFLKSQYLGMRFIFRNNYDLMHIHDPELLPIAIIGSYFGKKIIWDAHEDYYLQFKSTSKYRRYLPHLLHNPLRILVNSCLSLIDSRAVGIVCATKSISENYANPQTHVVGNEARIEEFGRNTPKFSSKYVIFTGTANYAHCFDEIVDAVKLERRLVLKVAGRNLDNTNLVRAKEILGSRLIDLGWLDRNQLANEILNSKVGFLTYENVETNQTNSPNKLFEFSAAGLPVVATPTLANKKWIDESGAGLLCKDFSSKSISESLHQLVHNEDIWSKCSKNAKDWSMINGNWDKSANELINLYKLILERDN